jgi:hypothetical protein
MSLDSVRGAAELRVHMALVNHLRGFVDPAQPTTYLPGSAEKMAVMTLREELEIDLLVPGDVGEVLRSGFSRPTESRAGLCISA